MSSSGSTLTQPAGTAGALRVVPNSPDSPAAAGTDHSAGFVPVGDWAGQLADAEVAGLSDEQRLAAVRELEELKATAAATQARLSVAFAESRRAAAGDLTRAEEAHLDRELGAQIAAARRESPHRGRRNLGIARALTQDLPHTNAALTRGELSEWRATLIVGETAWLTREDRTAVDAELAVATRDGFLTGYGDRKVADAARAITYRLDPAGAAHKNARAETERRVSLRPAPDTMAYLTALLPVSQAVSVYATLKARTTTCPRAENDQRTLDQLMADLFVTQLTGTTRPDHPEDATRPAPPPVQIELVMPARTLFGTSHDPAHLPQIGPIPASLARKLVRQADHAWIRRLYTNPTTGELITADTRARTFTGRLRDLVIWRDQTCRTPWCDAPIAHIDHLHPHSHGGPTNLANADGLCAACNHTKRNHLSRPDIGFLTLPPPAPPPPQPGAAPLPHTDQYLKRHLDDTG